MIIPAKWNGKCNGCGGPTKKGDDIEYAEGKAWHPVCYQGSENDRPDNEQELLAIRLGFVKHNEEEIRRMAEHWVIWKGHRDMLLLPNAANGDTAGRQGP